MNSPGIQGETSETSWVKIVRKYNHPTPLKVGCNFLSTFFSIQPYGF